MRRFSVLFLAAITVFMMSNLGCAVSPQVPADTPTASAPVRDGVFLHVSSGPENPHRVLMAMKMAELMSAEKDVLMYFDILGVNVLLADSAAVNHDGFTASDEQITKLIDLGVPIYACPACLAAAGKTPADLRAGIQVANKDAFFDFTEGRILSLDY